MHIRYLFRYISVLKIPVVAKDAEIVTQKIWKVKLKTNKKTQCYNIHLTLLQMEIQYFLELGLLV